MFDYHAAHRATPPEWLALLRIHGAKLVKASQREIAQYAIDQFPSAALDSAKLGSIARELGFAAEWAQCGFPQIVPDERLFASLAATSIPRESLSSFAPPWNCFVVRVPDRFHSLSDWGNGLELPVAYMSIRPFVDSGSHWQFEEKPSDAPGAALQIQMQSLGDLIDPALEEDDARQCMDWDSDHGKRTGDLLKESSDPAELLRWKKRSAFDLALRRAFVNCVLELNRDEHVERIGRGRGLTMRPLRGPPKTWTFCLKRPVVVDARHWLDGLGSGATRKQLAIQSLVRGHWKNQPCGDAAMDRKLIHIEPYWRGPEDAPIAVREHIMKRDAVL